MSTYLSEMLAQRIQEEELQDISIERVQKVATPLLVIGLGGAGIHAVGAMKKTFARQFCLPTDERGNLIPVPRRTAYLGIDTDCEARNFLAEFEFVNIRVEDIPLLLNPQKRDFNLSASEREWVDRRMADADLYPCVFRQSVRFQLLRSYHKVANAICSAVQRITAPEYGTGRVFTPVRIVIVAGVCGSTGGGIFLDVPQIVRHLMKYTLNGVSCHITGYIVMPDVFLSNPNIQHNYGMTRHMSMNSFAALKELDFWQNIENHGTPFAVVTDSDRIEWTQPPYDDCVLMSQETVNGMHFADGYQAVMNAIAENLLVYLAEETTNKSGNYAQTPAFLSFMSNLKAAEMNLTKRLPLKYGYQAVGVSSVRIPRQKMMYYEGSLLLGSFMPPRDGQGRLKPDESLLEDGKGLERAMHIVGQASQLYNHFKLNVPLPAFCDTPFTDRAHLEIMRQMQPRPHDRPDMNPGRWDSSVVRPAARQAAREYLDDAWGRFGDFARTVFTDPKLGPFSLRDYLESKTDGLLKELRGMLADWDTKAHRFNSDKAPRHQSCEDAWLDFVHPPLLGRRMAMERYLVALKEFYDQFVKAAFMEEYAIALHLLIQRVEEYLKHSLKPLCEDLDRLSREFDAIHVPMGPLESDLFPLSAVKERIDAVFADSNRQKEATLHFLNDLHTVSMMSVPSVDALPTGITFTYGLPCGESLLSTLKTELNTCFRQINEQSMDDFMRQIVGEDAAEQSAFMDHIAAAILDSSKPLFRQNPAAANEECFKFRFLSVPENSARFIRCYSARPDVIVKASALRDRITCITVWCCLPLYRYRGMDELEMHYYDALRDGHGSAGVHLVWNGDPDSSFQNNWCKLPSPAPYYFFGLHGPEQAEQRYAEIHALTERAFQAGMLEADICDGFPVYHLRVFCYHGNHDQPLPGAEIARQADELAASGNGASPDEKLKSLNALFESAEKETLCPHQSPVCMASYLGLEHEPVDPSAPNVCGNDVLMAKAQDNYARLTRELACAMAAGLPRWEYLMQTQVEGFEAIQKALKPIMDLAGRWETRIDYAKAFARIYIHGLIRFSVDGGVYDDDMGQKHRVIQDEPAEDIANLDPVILLAAFLADAGEQNETRRVLECRLKRQEDEFCQKEESGALTEEEVRALMDRAGELKKRAGILFEQENAALVEKRANTAVIGMRIALLRNILNECKDRLLELSDALDAIR